MQPTTWLLRVSGHLATREFCHQPTRHHETISPPANSPPSEVFSDKSRRNSCSGTIIFIDSLVCMHITTFTEAMSRELTGGIFETRCVVLVILRARICKLSVSLNEHLLAETEAFVSFLLFNFIDRLLNCFCVSSPAEPIERSIIVLQSFDCFGLRSAIEHIRTHPTSLIEQNRTVDQKSFVIYSNFSLLRRGFLESLGEREIKRVESGGEKSSPSRPRLFISPVFLPFPSFFLRFSTDGASAEERVPIWFQTVR